MRCVVVSDLHVGSTVGLWPRSHPVADGGEYKANKFQKWLLNCWEQATDEIRGLQPDVIVFNGDELQGTKANRDGQLVTNRTDIQVDAALEVVDPLVSLDCRRYVTKGSSWHVGKCAQDVEAFARQIGAERDKATNEHTRFDLYLKLGAGGPVGHFRHSIGVSNIPAYEATTPWRDAHVLIGELQKAYGRGAPDVRLMVRSHRHRAIHVTAPPGLHAVVTPGWQLATELVHKKGIAALPHLGFVIIEWDGKDIMVKLRTYPLPKPYIESL